MNKTMKVFSALSIIFVVMMHIGHNWIYEPLTYTPVWRMPSFIFISGYFFKEIYCLDKVSYLKRKFKSLIIPLYGYSLFYGLIITVLLNMNIISFGKKLDFTSYFIETFLHSHQYEFTSAMWFLPILFLTQIIYCFIKQKSPICLNYELLLMFLMILINFLSVYLSQIGIANIIYPNLFLPFLKVMFFICFFHLGYLYKVYIEDKDKCFNIFKLVIPLFINYSIAAFLCGNTQEITRLENLYFDSSWMNFQNKYIFIPFITSVCGIYFWLQISRIIAVAINKNDFIYKIGDNTFNIMTHHIFCSFVLNTIIFEFIKISNKNYFNFNYDLYYTNVWYKITNFWPFIDFMYVAIGIIGSIFIGYLFKEIKTLLKSFLFNL